jgi:hypothetical protein
MNEQPVLVRSARYGGPLTLLILGLGALILAACLVVFPRPPLWLPGAAIAALGMVLLSASLLWWGVELVRRVWVEPLPDGFVIRNWKGERTVADEEILSMALRHQSNYSQGLLKSTTRFFTVWVATAEGRREQFTMTNTFGLNAADPLADLIKRVNDRLFDQAREDMQHGEAVRGEGWSLESGTLTVKGGRGGPEDITVADLTAVEVVDNHVCCWVRGRDEAVAKVPLRTVNAHLLLQLLQEQVQPGKGEPAEPEDGRLGRIIFERRQPHSTAVTLMVLAALLGFGGLGLGAFGVFKPVLFLVGLGLLAGAVASGLGAAHTYLAFFRCHEWGVRKRGLFGDRQLRYADVASFTYNAIRMFVNGAYSGTTFTLTFEPYRELRRSRIHYSVQLRNVDTELDNLRDQIAAIIAARMLRQHQEGREVRWTANLCYLRDGLEYRPAGWIGRKDPEVVPYDQITGYNVEQGTFSLWAWGKDKPVVQENIGSPNFFPGFMMLVQLTRRDGTPISVAK